MSRLHRRDLPERVPAAGATRGQRDRHRHGARTARGTDRPPARAEIIIVDCSGSMSGRPDQARPGRRPAPPSTRCATACAFAVIAGTDTAEQLYPPTGQLARRGRTPGRGAAAKRAIAGCGPAAAPRSAAGCGSPAQLFATAPGAAAARHPAHRRRRTSTRPTGELARALGAVRGPLQCDCRGVGTDWEVAELRADRLGAARHRRHRRRPAGPRRRLPRDDGARRWARRSRTSRCGCGRRGGADVKFVKQVAPHDRGPDRPPHRVRRPAPATTRPGRGAPRAATTTSASRSRAGVVGRGDAGRGRVEPRRAATRCSARALVRAVWTDDTALSTRINPQVAHYTGQAELADGDPGGPGGAARRGDAATRRPRSSAGRSQLAARARQRRHRASCWPRWSTSTTPTGTVRLRAEASKAARMTLDSRSTVTVRVRGQG